MDDQADGHGHDAGVLAHIVRQRHLIAVFYLLPRIGATSVMPPDEQSMTSTPLVFRMVASRALCSGPHPALSSTDSRTNSGLSSGHCVRTASVTSVIKRIRLASEPPYSSLR